MQAEMEATSENVRQTNASLEMGYLIVEDSLVSVTGVAGRGLGISSVGHWLNVKLLRKEASTDDTDDADETSTDDRACRRCNVAIQVNESGQCELDLTSLSAFDGRMVRVNCSACRNRQRPDAALMLGLVAACGDEAIVKRVLISFKDDTCQRAALVITVSFPFLLLGNEGDRSIRQIEGKKRLGKPLHPAMQLLLSTIESDWSTLDGILKIATSDTTAAQPTVSRIRRHSIFPPDMSLEELYTRIEGSPRTQKVFEERRHSQLLVQPTECSLARLPRDILVEKLGPFLHASSLDSLRCSCTYLHNTLRTVVPGLKLHLYSHQITSLSWMRTRESSSIMETDCFGRSPATATQSPCGDLHRAITGGQSVLLSVRPKKDGPPVDIRVSQSTGYELSVESLRALPRHVARGGLLCDDPGLGKTVTVLSLILQTVGLSTTPVSTESSEKVKGPPEVEDVFDAYWRERMTTDFRRPALLKLLNELLRSRRRTTSFFFPSNALRKAVGADKYESDFCLFERDVESAILEANPDEEATANEFVEAFRGLVTNFKQQQVQSAKRGFSRASSAVAAMLEEQAKHKFVESLFPSSATLLVIPAVLMEHWQTQIAMHVNLRYFSDKEPLIFEYMSRGKDGMSVAEAKVRCQTERTHFPMVFLDRGGTRPLPPAEFLATFQIVITTTSRFMNEWKNGSFQHELERSEIGENIPAYSSFAVSDEACPLLKVHWLRMVVDEGHSMGKGRENSTIQFASWISAERRWAMSGTPTKQTATQMDQLRGLMRFLQHDFFTPRLEGDLSWRNNINRCWKDGNISAFFRLRSLLGFLMKRHTKLDIAELPPPQYNTEVIPMSGTEVATYNTLVSGIQSNILLTGMKGKTSGEQDSLLHRSQAKYARQALSNVRRVCVGWSRVIPTLSDKFFGLFVELLRDEHELPEETVNELRQYVHRAETEELSKCSCCAMELSVLLVQPCCGGMICTECMDNKTPSCYLCDDVFDIDDLQRLQPGFVLEWKSNLKDPKVAAPDVETVTGPVIPPSALENARAIGFNLIRPPGELRGSRKFGDGHTCHYDRSTGDGKCALCSKEHEPCNLTNEHSRCASCYRLAEDCPEEESKGSYLVNRLLKLHRAQRDRKLDPSYLARDLHAKFDAPRPLKVIVFSQFRQALNVIGDRLLKRFGTACVAEYWGRYRTQELHKFVWESDCFCMLLGKDGSEGLDLSFVTHIFFLEEIWDKSLQEQAVARAWRMGAKGRVDVETLVAQNSVEETMQELESDQLVDGSNNWAAIKSSRSDYQRTKTQTLLRTLRLNTDYHRDFKTSDSDAAGQTSARVRSALTHPIQAKPSDEAPPPSKKPRTTRVTFK